MITVLGRKTSSNVQAVMFAIGELGLEHIREDIGGSFGGNDKPEYLKKNPMGLVPVLEDGETTLFESSAIVRYLGAAYGDGTFYPTDPKKRAQLDIWAEWIKTSFYPVLIGKLFFPLVRLDPKTVSGESIKNAENQIKPLAGILEDVVKGGKWSDGDNFTFADVIVGHLLYRYFELEFDKIETPNLLDYYERLCERPAYQEHVMVSYETLRFRA